MVSLCVCALTKMWGLYGGPELWGDRRRLADYPDQLMHLLRGLLQDGGSVLKLANQHRAGVNIHTYHQRFPVHNTINVLQ